MKDLVKNPIGIIALFISLIYGFANLLLGATAKSLTPDERFPLIIFIVLFPVVVLGIFYLLVSRHHGKLYAPGDYKDDKSFLRTLSQEEREKKLEIEVEEALPTVNVEQLQLHKDVNTDSQAIIPERSVNEVREELRLVEELAVAKFEREFNLRATRDVGVGDTGANFDALFEDGNKPTFLEVKAIRRHMLGNAMLDRVLYNAVIADKYLNSNMKLIIAVVHSFSKDELARVEKFWRKRIEKCPVSIELRFIPRDELSS
ncbi:MAG: hypothetical protein M0P59_07030 [Gallionella sp.]|nr:hypothetical protein [Gallionella sp.]MCK9353897.1 hypothetical protein [Gallionella sp.]